MAVKLYYFDARGFAEPIRIILHYGGQEFEDIRIPLAVPRKVPQEIKDKTRWGQIPFVEFEGKKLGQSLAITRYFARKYDLVPKDAFEAALCDEYVDACRDFIALWNPVFTEKDKEKRSEKFAEAEKASRERFLSVFESLIKANDGTHLLGNTLTWADIYLAHAVSNVKMVFGKCVVRNDFPAINKLMENVWSTPGIKEYVEKRTETLF